MVGNLAIFYGFAHEAARLVGVRAVAETTLVVILTYFREVVADLLWFVLDEAELFHARRVDDEAAGHTVHAGEGGGVHALAVYFRDPPDLQVQSRVDAVDES